MNQKFWKYVILKQYLRKLSYEQSFFINYIQIISKHYLDSKDIKRSIFLTNVCFYFEYENLCLLAHTSIKIMNQFWISTLLLFVNCQCWLSRSVQELICSTYLLSTANIKHKHDCVLLLGWYSGQRHGGRTVLIMSALM